MSLTLKVLNTIMSKIVPSIQAAHAHGQITTTITSFGGIDYCLDPAAAQVISFQPSRPSDGFFGSFKGDLRPCTVINQSKDYLDKEDLDAFTFDLAPHEDVWTPTFAEGKTSCRYEMQSRIAYDMTRLNSRHTPNTSDFKDMSCTKQDPPSLRIHAYSFAGRPLCNPAINWGDFWCIAVVQRRLQRLHDRVYRVQHSAPFFSMAHHGGELT